MAAGKECGACIPKLMICQVQAEPAEQGNLSDPDPGLEYFKVHYRWCLEGMDCEPTKWRRRKPLTLRVFPREAGGAVGRPPRFVRFEPGGLFDHAWVYNGKNPWTDSLCCAHRHRDRLPRSCVPLSPPALYHKNCCNTYLAELVKCCTANGTAAWGSAFGAQAGGGTCHTLLGPSKQDSGQCCKSRDLFLTKPKAGSGSPDAFTQSVTRLTSTIAQAIQDDLSSEFTNLLSSCNMRDSRGKMAHTTEFVESPCFPEFTSKCVCIGSPPNKCP